MTSRTEVRVATLPRAVPAGDAALAARQEELLRAYDLLDLPADAELDALVRVAAAVADVPTATINVLETQRQCSLAAHGATAPREVARHDSICVTTAQLGRPWSTADLSADRRFAGHPFVDGRIARVRQYASVPLVVEGVAIGTLCVSGEQVRELTPTQLDRLTDLAGVVVALLERRRQSREIAALAGATEAASAALTTAAAELARARAFDHALLEALPVGVIAVGADGRLAFLNRVVREWHGRSGDADQLPEKRALEVDLRHADGDTPVPADRLPLARSLRGEHLRDGVELVIAPAGLPSRSVRCRSVPVHDSSGRLLGAVATLADISAQRALETQLRLAALHDALTGLPNRSLLVDRLEHALARGDRSGGRLAVLYCDLDGFKAVNDRYGHAAGDDVLRQAAGRMQHAVRPGDTVGRIGGDEFVVLCPGVESAETAAAIAGRIEAALREPLTSCDGAEHEVGISIGVVLSQPGSTPETVLTDADEAMYAVKAAHRARQPALLH